MSSKLEWLKKKAEVKTKKQLELERLEEIQAEIDRKKEGRKAYVDMVKQERKLREDLKVAKERAKLGVYPETERDLKETRVRLLKMIQDEVKNVKKSHKEREEIKQKLLETAQKYYEHLLATEKDRKKAKERFDVWITKQEEDYKKTEEAQRNLEAIQKKANIELDKRIQIAEDILRANEINLAEWWLSKSPEAKQVWENAFITGNGKVAFGKTELKELIASLPEPAKKLYYKALETNEKARKRHNEVFGVD